DGVPDGLDKCPNTPKGATVDANGCPLDSDLDGVPDGIDQCPNTPAGTKVDATGCPLPVEAVRAPTAQAAAPAKCPPAPPGSQVDANGCLVLFAPEPARPTAPGAPAPRPTLILKGVNFETGRSVLTRDSYLVLDAVAASLVANPEIRIEVGGYTDSTGTKFSNLRLSQARAAAVRFYLARKGVAPVRMVAKGYGASGYIAPNGTAAGRATASATTSWGAPRWARRSSRSQSRVRRICGSWIGIGSSTRGSPTPAPPTGRRTSRRRCGPGRPSSSSRRGFTRTKSAGT